MGFPLIGIVIATLLVFLYLRRGKKAKHGLKELPGPRGLPIVGNMLQLGKFQNEVFCKWSREYGDLYQVKLAQNTVVVISSPKLTKEMFSNDHAFTGKPQFDGFDVYLDGPGLGILQSENDFWEGHRRFLLRQLRDFGFGKSVMEDRIMDELNEILDKFKAKEGKPVTKMKETLRLAVVNALWTILTSQRLSQDDPKLNKLAANTSDTFNEIIEQGGLLIFMPWLRHIIPEFSGFNAIRAMLDENKDTFESVVNTHKAEFEDDSQRDFIDMFLGEMKKAENDPTSIFHGKKAERHLVTALFDLFLAGSETTSTTLAWAILYLSKFSHVQKKLQQEILEITGNSRKTSVVDRPNMPYTQALMDEIFRFSSIVPDGVQHRALADREFHGYHIPKGAWLQPNLYFIHHDPKLWGDPQNFRPERFLSADGKKYEKSENMQAFQIGRRQCVGETLARDTIFLYLTNIFQQFNIELDPASPEATLDCPVGFIRTPKPYFVIMKDRLTK